MSDDTIELTDLRERVEEVRVAMVTTTDERGLLSSRPLTVQRIDEHGNVYFIVARDADWLPRAGVANVALVDESRTWVSVSGTTELVTGTSLLSDLWDEATDAFFPDGRDGAVVLQVHADRWEYWTAPNRIGQMIELAKAYAMDRPPEFGESGTIEI